ncbi:hypothetical protein MKZ38_008903 [Zalerion maritima]|uniref:Probable transporter MCH1 n=1 Tax=Zalerion maritima TaxID=339359 RepID=A0AAD5RH74_9PEZI|nr:hypothetical protein MKZ38_008903 [Zalerion maritima]
MAPEAADHRPGGPGETSPLLLQQEQEQQQRRPISISSSVATSTTSTSSASRRRHNAVRAVSFSIAVVAALCGNSISVFSLYAPVIQRRLHYNQFQVNGLAIAASISLYTPVPLMGYVCDRFGPRPLCLVASIFFGLGYGGAAVVYRYVDRVHRGFYGNNGDGGKGGDGLEGTYYMMLAAFVCIGIATCGMYLSSVAVTAKNFGKGKHRGLALSIPITCFGLSGMWISQFGSWVLCEKNEEDGSKGDVDVYRFFGFLAFLLVVVGILSVFLLRIVNEEEMIEEAVEELTSSGILDGSALLSRHNSAYDSIPVYNGRVDEEAPRVQANGTAAGGGANDGDADNKDPTDEDDARWKKNFLLNAETRRFLYDHTMWWLTIAFFLIIGPGEAFINNMGTIIGTLYNPSAVKTDGPPPTRPATHVSIVAFTSTAARIIGGTLSDILAPNPATDHPQISGAASPRRAANYKASRVSFLLFFSAAMSIGFLTQASGFVQEHGERFWIISSLIGFGYGGVFSITPIIITVIWGVENFATNWGIVAMFPAVGSIVWGLIYSAVYESGAKEGERESRPGQGETKDEDLFCYGTHCYASAFWAMTISIWLGSVLVTWAWKGRNGWAQRRVVV